MKLTIIGAAVIVAAALVLGGYLAGGGPFEVVALDKEGATWIVLNRQSGHMRYCTPQDCHDPK